MRRAFSVGICTAVVATGLWLPGASAAGTDRPDTFSTAKAAPVSSNSTWLRESISTAKDKDWFRFTVSQPAYALVTLGHLPANYSLGLYDSHHQLVGSSDRGGRRFELLYSSLGAGDYFVEVQSPSGAHSAAPFWLNFRPLPAGMVIAEKRTIHNSSGFDIKGELLNNTSTWLEVRRLHVTWFDRKGNTLGSCDEGVIPGPVPPRHRIDFDVENGEASCGTQPSGAASYTIVVHSATTSVRRPAGLVLTQGIHGATAKQRIYKGTIKNTSSQTIRGIYPTVIEYNPLGLAIAFGYDHIASLAPGKTRSYTMAINTTNVPAPNAYREFVSITQS